jgi:hypothetical protein
MNLWCYGTNSPMCLTSFNQPKWIDWLRWTAIVLGKTETGAPQPKKIIYTLNNMFFFWG